MSTSTRLTFRKASVLRVPAEMMRLSLLPPLMVLCSVLLFQKPSSLAFPVSQHDPHLEQADVLHTRVSPQQAVSRRTSNKIFHPPTGFCVIRRSLRDPLLLGPCDRSDFWSYTPQQFLTVKGTYFCLQARGASKPVKLGIVCTEANSKWDIVRGAKSRLLMKLSDGQSVCLDVDSNGTIMTNPCSGVSESDGQWFEVMPIQSELYEVGDIEAE